MSAGCSRTTQAVEADLLTVYKATRHVLQKKGIPVKSDHRGDTKAWLYARRESNVAHTWSLITAEVWIETDPKVPHKCDVSIRYGSKSRDYPLALAKALDRPSRQKFETDILALIRERVDKEEADKLSGEKRSYDDGWQ